MLKIKVNCGCGFFKEDKYAIDHGVAHSAKTGHEVEIRGTISKDDEPFVGTKAGEDRLKLKFHTLDNDVAGDLAYDAERERRSK